MHLTVKICGLSSEETLDAALDAGADMVGFVFFPPSPRFLSPEQAGRLAARARGRAEIVALSVDMDDAGLRSHRCGPRPGLAPAARKGAARTGGGREEALRPEGHEGDRRPRGGRPRRCRSVCRHRRPPPPRRQATQGRRPPGRQRRRLRLAAPGKLRSGYPLPALRRPRCRQCRRGPRDHRRPGRRCLVRGRDRAGREKPRSDPRLHRRRPPRRRSRRAGPRPSRHDRPAQFLPHRTGRARLLRHLWRPFRCRNADAADPRARRRPTRRRRPIPPSRPSCTTSTPTTPAGRARSISPSG